MTDIADLTGRRAHLQRVTNNLNAAVATIPASAATGAPLTDPRLHGGDRISGFNRVGINVAGDHSTGDIVHPNATRGPWSR